MKIGKKWQALKSKKYLHFFSSRIVASNFFGGMRELSQVGFSHFPPIFLIYSIFAEIYSNFILLFVRRNLKLNVLELGVNKYYIWMKKY